MNNFVNLGPNTSVAFSLPIGIDVTMLLAASSFIQASDGLSDPRAREAFEAVSTAFCNGSQLLLPLPSGRVGHGPFFLDLWNGAFETIPELELSDAAFNRLIDEGRAIEFEKYAEAFPREFARWIAFQFTSRLSHAQIGRTERGIEIRCQPIVAKMVKEKRFRKLRTELCILDKRDSLSCPWPFRGFLGTTFSDISQLAIAYAMSVALRGFSYAIAIGSYQHISTPLYCHHWVRDRTVGSFEKNGFACDTAILPLTQFPWGSILTKVFDPRRPLGSRDLSKVMEVLGAVRQLAPEVEHSLQNGILSKRGDRSTNNRLTDQELLVAEWLQKSGVTLRSKKQVTSLLADFLKNLGGIALEKAAEQAESTDPRSALVLSLGAAGAIGIGTFVEQVSTQQKSTFLRTLGYKARIRFFRKSFWKSMEDPGIRAALRSVNAEA
jgi:hypothetical protein